MDRLVFITFIVQYKDGIMKTPHADINRKNDLIFNSCGKWYT